MEYALSTSTKDSKIRMVHPDTLGAYIGWFGPVVQTKDYPVSFVDRIMEAFTRQDFFGYIDTEEATMLADHSDPGSYLVRLSSHSPGTYAISGKTESGKSFHERFQRIDHRYIWRKLGQTFDTLDQAVTAMCQQLTCSKLIAGSKTWFVSNNEKTSEKAGYPPEEEEQRKIAVRSKSMHQQY